MPSPDVSIVIPAFNEEASLGRTLSEITEWLRRTGLEYEILVVDDGSTDATRDLVAEFGAGDSAVRLLSLARNEGKGAAVKRGVLEARGEVIAFIDADLPYQPDNLGQAIALVHSGTTDIAIGGRDLDSSESDPSYPLVRRFMGWAFSFVVRTFLVPRIPDTQCGLKAFSSGAAKVLFSETRLSGFGFDFEILFLARKYGFRIERIPVAMSHRHESKVRLLGDSLQMLFDVYRVRRLNRLMVYRAPRRCIVCFSAEVMTLTQIRSFVVRACHRCKCRYLHDFPSEEELDALYNSGYFNSSEEMVGYASGELTPAAAKTNERRLAVIKRVVSPRARLLEVGAGPGHFGAYAGADLDYTGIDMSKDAAREGRARGLKLFCSSLGSFVNLDGQFDAVTMFHVFEHLSDPHDALAKVKDLLKPGGILFLITPDTESLLCAISGDRWVSYKFPEHLILYSRSALIELLEHSGFEIVSVSSDYEYCSHDFLLSRIERLNPLAAKAASIVLPLLPNPLPVGSGSIRILAKRRAGPPVTVRTIPSAEPTHAR